MSGALSRDGSPSDKLAARYADPASFMSLIWPTAESIRTGSLQPVAYTRPRETGGRRLAAASGRGATPPPMTHPSDRPLVEQEPHGLPGRCFTWQ